MLHEVRMPSRPRDTSLQHAHAALYHVRGGNAEDAACEARTAVHLLRAERRNASRRERDACLRGLGLVRARGALGGVYWE